MKKKGLCLHANAASNGKHNAPAPRLMATSRLVTLSAWRIHASRRSAYGARPCVPWPLVMEPPIAAPTKRFSVGLVFFFVRGRATEKC